MVLDVRRDDEWAAGHIPGALHVPLHDLLHRLDEIPRQQLWVHCESRLPGQHRVGSARPRGTRRRQRRRRVRPRGGTGSRRPVGEPVTVGPATEVTAEVTSGVTSVEAPTPTAVEEGRWRIAPGLLLALVVATIATMLGRLAPIVGGPVFGIVIGAVAAAVIPALRAPRWKPGCTVASKQVLQSSIVVLGAGAVVAAGRGRGQAIAAGHAGDIGDRAGWRVDLGSAAQCPG